MPTALLFTIVIQVTSVIKDKKNYVVEFLVKSKNHLIRHLDFFIKSEITKFLLKLIQHDIGNSFQYYDTYGRIGSIIRNLSRHFCSRKSLQKIPDVV